MSEGRLQSKALIRSTLRNSMLDSLKHCSRISQPGKHGMTMNTMGLRVPVITEHREEECLQHDSYQPANGSQFCWLNTAKDVSSDCRDGAVNTACITTDSPHGHTAACPRNTDFVVKGSGDKNSSKSDVLSFWRNPILLLCSKIIHCYCW